MRWWVVIAVGGTGCAGIGTAKDDSTAPPGACALAEASDGCPSCYEGPYTCAFEGTWVARGSCGDCSARQALYQALCDAGSPASADAIEAGISCAPTECEVVYGCACTPTCDTVVPAGSTAADVSSMTPCTPCATPEPEPGPCAWNGSACGFLIP